MAAPMTDLALYTAPEAAKQLRIGVAELRAAVQRGELRFVLIGRRKRFKLPDLELWIQNNTRESCASSASAARRSGNMTSRSTVLDFEALRAQQTEKRRKPPLSGSGARR
jgi:excisionase family DNA binding protein